jgi:hypothetical protein
MSMRKTIRIRGNDAPPSMTLSAPLAFAAANRFAFGADEVLARGSAQINLSRLRTRGACPRTRGRFSASLPISFYHPDRHENISTAP